MTATHDILTESSGFAAFAVAEAADTRHPDQRRVHGVIAGVGDISRGLSGKLTRWPADVLEDAAERDVLVGKPITIADGNDPEQHVGVEMTDDGLQLTGAVPMHAKVGEITATAFDDGVGWLFEGFIADRHVEELVERGLAQVSPVVAREVDRLEDHDEDIPDGAVLWEATEIHEGRDLAIVADGGFPSNDITPGALPDEESAVAEALASHFGAEVGSQNGIGFSADLFRILSPEEDDRFQADVLGIGINMPNAGVYIDWNIDAWPDDEQLEGPHVSDYDSMADLEQVTEGVIEPLETVSAATAEAAAAGVGTGTETTPAEPGADGSGGDDGPHDPTDGGEGQSTPDADADNKRTPSMDDLTEAERELLAVARQTDDPTVVEAGTVERLSEHEELIEAAESTKDPAVVSETDYDALQSRIETIEDLLNEALTEQKGLKKTTVEAMSFEAKAAEFETEDGGLELEALAQVPESGDGGGNQSPGGSGGVTDDDRERIKNIKTRLDTAGNVLPPKHIENLKQEACEAAGVDDYDAALEVV